MKTTSKRKLISAFFIVLFLAWVNVAFTATTPDEAKPWNAPETAKKIKNPLKGDAAALADGKTLFMKHCKSCHGAKGLGDGPKSKELDTECGDFSQKSFQSQTDGEIIYKIKEGRDDMPSFKKKITDQDELWSIINYVRSLAK
jgi:mono/diheme cytochrome c family protein